ncbi:MAG: hypothetical protein LBD86_02795 [Spirochaetaceae bacterium]|jgi:hypothetical protein|nr:hypothetical protein [Spirochaetaceae bacterium]
MPDKTEEIIMKAGAEIGKKIRGKAARFREKEKPRFEVKHIEEMWGGLEEYAKGIEGLLRRGGNPDFSPLGRYC